jgi:hypothetical protein
VSCLEPPVKLVPWFWEPPSIKGTHLPISFSSQKLRPAQHCLGLMLSGFYFLTGSGSWADYRALGLAILNFEGKIITTRIRSNLKTETKKQTPAGVRPKTRTGTKTCFIQVPILHSLRNVFLMLQMFVYVLFFPTVVRHVVILWKNFKHTLFWIINFRVYGGDGIRNVIIMFGTCLKCAILLIFLGLGIWLI